jgi:hypothetical protein
MKRYECTVTREDKYIIEFDENVINEEFMEEFRQCFYNYKTLADHAKNIAQLRARFPDDSFIEGYGRVKVNGSVPFFFGEERGREDCEDAINIKVVSEDRNCDVEVKEIK